MGAFESGSMAQPLTARPEGVTVALSKAPNGGRLGMSKTNQLERNPFEKLGKGRAFMTAQPDTVTEPVAPSKRTCEIRPPHSPLPDRLSTVRRTS